MAGSAAARKGPEPDDVARFARYAQAGAPGAHAYVALLGLSDFDPVKLLRAVARGLPVHAFERLQRNLGVSQARLAALVGVAERTLTRRRDGGRLSPEESDRLLRTARVFGRALELFDADAAAARAWLGSPQPALGGAVPFEIATTDVGAREVETALGRVEHGVFA